MKIIIFLLTLTLALGSCTKNRERTASISGTVIDYGSGEAVPNAKIHVKDGFNGSGPFTDSDFTTDAEEIVYTDEEGFFDVELTGRFNPYLYPSKGDEYKPYDGADNAVTTSAEVYKKGSENIGEVIRLKAFAWMEGYAKNRRNEKDSLNIIALTEDFIQAGVSWKDRYADGYKFPSGIPIGNDYWRFKIEYKRDGVWNEMVDSVFIAKGETFQDTIYY